MKSLFTAGLIALTVTLSGCTDYATITIDTSNPNEATTAVADTVDPSTLTETDLANMDTEALIKVLNQILAELDNANVDYTATETTAVVTSDFNYANWFGSYDEMTSQSIVPSVFTKVVSHQDVFEAGTQVGTLYQIETTGINTGIIFEIGLSGTGDTIQGIHIIQENETPELGHTMLTDPTFLAQFDGLSIDMFLLNQVDGTAGVSTTLNGIVTGVEEAIAYHKLDKVAALAQDVTPIVAQYFPSATSEIDKTSTSTYVTKVKEVYQGSTLQGVIYEGVTSGRNQGIYFRLVIDATLNKVIGLDIISDNEVRGKTLLADNTYLQTFEQRTAENLISSAVDTVAGLSQTSTGLTIGIQNVLIEFSNTYLGTAIAEASMPMISGDDDDDDDDDEHEYDDDDDEHDDDDD